MPGGENLDLCPAFVPRLSKAAPTGRDSVAQGAAKRSPGLLGKHSAKPHRGEIPQSQIWPSSNPRQVDNSQMESRPPWGFAVDDSMPPGLNALGYRISPLLGLPGDCVASQRNTALPGFASSICSRHRHIDTSPTRERGKTS